MRLIRHLARLLRECVGFSWEHKAWWLIPIVLILLLVALLVVSGQSVAPFVYTLF